jgi:hypothetical protein
MSDLAVHEAPDAPSADDPAAAFEAMRGELALLRYAVQGFAGKQEEIAARDYAPDLARLIDVQEQLCGAVRTLDQRPGVALTPEMVAAQIERAAATARKADHEALSATASQLDTMIGRVRTEQQQRDALIWAWLAGMMTVMTLMTLAQWIGARAG